ncbi:MAG: T9SS type A sorting domain-containing protein [Ignavibacteria bacterium]|nr:T9SS type A sorting domain-containing protein [Ignavibacteria bacterium]
MKQAYRFLTYLLLTTPSFGQIPTDNLVMHFSFDGNAEDQSGFGNHGTVVGPTLTQDRFGNPESAYLFDGANDYIDFGNDASTILLQDMTLSLWVKPNDFPIPNQHDPIVFRGEWGETEATNQPYHFYLINFGGLSHFGIGHEYGSGANEGGNTNTPADLMWTHVAIVRDHIEKTYSFYINGEADTTLSYSENPTGGQAGTGYLGWSPAAITQYFDGCLDDVRMYQRTLTNEEILALYEETHEPPVLTCEPISFFAAKCNSRGAAQAIILLLNSTVFAGQSVEVLIDSTAYPVQLETNGLHTVGKLKVRGAGYGIHTVTLVVPSGCFDPISIVCQVDREAGDDILDNIWAEYGLEGEPWASEELEHSGPNSAAYPNPFNPSTTIRYSLPASQHVSVRIFDTLGKLVTTLLDVEKETGTYEVVWDGRNSEGHRLSSGIYFFRVSTNDWTHTGKILMLK